MGERTKQLLPFKGEPLLAHTVKTGLAAGFSPLILVLGYEADRIKNALSPYTVDITFNPDYTGGMATSVLRGLDRLNAAGPVKGAFFLLGDQPLVRTETLATLRKAALKLSGGILIPTFKGRRGNPVYFDARFFPELKQVTGDQGGRLLVKKYARAVKKIAVNDPGICLDIDTPGDYDSLCCDTKADDV